MLKVYGSVAIALVSLVFSDAKAALAVTFNLQSATVRDINNAFDTGVLTSEELVQLYLNRIEAYDTSGPSVNAIFTTNVNALEIARELDLERKTTGPRSLLHGIPFLFKDNHDTFDMPTTGGSAALIGSIPPDDAFVVARLRDAGAIIFGKAATDEFAISGSGYNSITGQTLNPYNTLRAAAGSSGGSGAAIAANFSTLATGSDTGGSLRTPCAFQGLVCVRPTRGLLSLDGIIPFVLSRDMIGPMGRSVEDVAIALGVMAEFDPNNPGIMTPIAPPPIELDKFFNDYTQFLDPNAFSGARLGLVTNYIGDENGVDPEITRLVNEAIEIVKGLGAEIVEVTFDSEFLSINSGIYGTATSVEQELYLEAYLRTLSPEYPKTLEELIAVLESPEIADSDTPSRVLGTLRRSALVGSPDDPEYIRIGEELNDFLRGTLIDTLDSLGLDTFMFPTVNTFARPALGVSDPTFVSLPGSPPRQALLSSSTGLPDVMVPLGFGDQGLPMTLSFTGRPYDEGKLLGLAYAFEQKTMFYRPPSLTPVLVGEQIKPATIPEHDGVLSLVVIGGILLGYARFKPRKEIAFFQDDEGVYTRTCYEPAQVFAKDS